MSTQDPGGAGRLARCGSGVMCRYGTGRARRPRRIRGAAQRRRGGPFLRTVISMRGERGELSSSTNEVLIIVRGVHYSPRISGKRRDTWQGPVRMRGRLALERDGTEEPSSSGVRRRGQRRQLDAPSMRWGGVAQVGLALDRSCRIQGAAPKIPAESPAVP